MPWFPSVINSEILSVHAALLPVGPQGKVLMFGGDEHNPAQGGTDTTPATAANVDRTALYDIATKAVTRISSPTTDVFCAGHAFLGDGRLLVTGGTESWGGAPAGGPGGGHGHFHGNFGGHQASWIYNPLQNTWTRAADLGFRTGPGQGGGRWYPTVLTLPSGDLVAFGGHPSRRSQNWHENNLPERYSRAANSWSWYPNPISFEHPSLPGNWYPRMHLIRGGWIFITTTHGGSCRFFDPNTGALVGPVVAAAPAPYNSGWDYSVIMLPLVPGDGYRARLLAVNGVNSSRIELNVEAGAPAPAWVPAGTRQGSAATKARNFSCPVYLPTGQIFISGGINGNSDSQAVKEPELYSPDINWTARAYGPGAGTWQTIEEPAQVARNYHTAALLLADGSVFTASSSRNGSSGDPATVGERNIEIFQPPYFSDPNRPLLVDAPGALNYGNTEFTVQTGSTAQAAAIRKVALIRCGSVTHAADYDQRYVALAFTHEAGTANLRATYPADPSVLPPGWYMLWVVDASDRPCQAARFVRIAHQSCYFYTDRSTFSVMEVDAKLGVDVPARFNHAIAAVFDGFLASELAGGTPTVTLHWDHAAGPSPAGISLQPYAPQPENPALGPDVPQRTTYRFDLLFADNLAYGTFSEQRTLIVKAQYKGVSAAAPLLLVKQPNPFMLDGEVPWLSTDVRVFQVRADQMWGAVPAPGNDPITFIRAVLNDYNGRTNNAAHPFHTISQDQAQSRLELAGNVGGRRVYNFAVAKVRYLAAAVPANDVKVFFRMFRTASSSMAYNPTTEYRRAGTGAGAIPLLGLNGGEIVSLPFFATQRVNTAAVSMASQTDDPNRRSLTPAAPNEFVGYFGCWLDINQPEVHFPDSPAGDGPYTNRRSILQLVRGLHQCLVAEVFFDPNPATPTPPNAAPPLLPWGSTPGTSDKLSQRNLVIMESDNPGGPDTHTVTHSFEVRPSRTAFLGGVADGGLALARVRRNGRPDELAIHWENLPPGTTVSLFMPEVTADELLALAAATRTSAIAFEKEDEHTVRLSGGTITYVPLPGGRTRNLVGLLTVRLPDTVVKGQVFSAVVQQIDGFEDRVIGSFQITIPVSTAGAILPRATKELSLLRYIAASMPPGDRWQPVFTRWLDQFSARVEGLGGDPDRIEPSPDGTGKAPRPDCSPRALWGLSAVTAAILTLMGIVPLPYGAPIAAAGLVLLVALVCWAVARCRPTPCKLVPPLLLGTVAAGAVLGLLALLGLGRLAVLMLAVSAVLSLVLSAWMVLRGCSCGCEDEDRGARP